jgi:hypothetical protein
MPPLELTYRNLQRFIPDRQFAIVTTLGSTTAPLMNKIMQRTSNPWVMGINDLTVMQGDQIQFDRRRMRKQKRTVLVDAEALESLTETEKLTLNAQLLPFSLHELLLRRFHEDPMAFGKDLLRTARHIEQVALIQESK